MQDQRLPSLHDLHIFPYKGAFLAFHPVSFSLFRVNELFGNILNELRNGQETATIAESFGVPVAELEKQLRAIVAKVESDSKLVSSSGEDAGRPRKISLTLHVSNACNLDCVYCYAKGGNYGQQTRVRMDPDLAIKAVECMYRNFENIGSILFFGGEPTLALDVIESVCAHIESKFTRGEISALPKYKMVTNGTLINDQALRLIRQRNIQVTVSVDGPKEINDKLRPYKGGQGSYDSIHKGFYRIFNETGRIPGVEATYTKAHLDAGLGMQALIEFLNREFMFTMGTVAHAHLPEGHPLAISQKDRSAEMTDTLHGLFAAMSRGELPRVERSMLSPIMQFMGKTQSRFQCIIGYGSFAVTTEGEIYPCQVFIGRPEFAMGTVEEFDWKNPSAKLRGAIEQLTFRDKEKNPLCRGCWGKAFCFSCPGSRTFAANKNQVPKHFCKQMQDWVEKVLALIYELRNNPEAWESFLRSMKQLGERLQQTVGTDAARQGSLPTLEPADYLQGSDLC